MTPLKEFSDFLKKKGEEAMTTALNLFLCLSVSFLLVGCPGLAEKIDQVRDMGNPNKNPRAKRTSQMNPTLSGDNSANRQIQTERQSRSAQIRTEESSQNVPLSSGNGIGKWNTATTADERCDVLLDWVSQLEREYPEKYKEVTASKRSTWQESQYANLFRDKYFVPVFGAPYEQMSESERSTLHRAATRYEKGQCMFERQQEIRPYYKVLGLAFNPFQELKRSREGAGIFSYLESMNAEEDRMNEALAKIEQFPLTQASLTQLLAELNLAGGGGRGNAILQWELRFVWPSEISAFHDAVRQKAKTVAMHLLDQTVAEAAALPPTLANVKLITKDLSQKTVAYSEVAGNSQETQSRQAALQNNANEMLRGLLDEQLKKLVAIPNTWAGLEESQKWHAEFRQHFEELETLPALENAHNEFSKKREIIFQGAIKEFEAKIKAIRPPTYANMDRASDVLHSTFSLPGDQSLQSYAEYQKVVRAYQAGGLSPIVSNYLKKLRGIPQNLSGSLNLIEWRNAFDKEFVMFRDHPLVLDSEKEWDAKRQLTLAVSKPEFEKKLKGFPPDNRGLKQGAQLLDKIFSLPNDQTLPIFEEYEQILLGHSKFSQR